MNLLITSLSLSISAITFGQYTLIPDGNFEAALITMGLDVMPPDGQVATANISSVTILDVSGKNISELTGIKDFIALQDLDCLSII